MRSETVSLACVALAFYFVSRSERSEIAVVRQMSENDPLTGLHNISYFRKVSAQKLADAVRGDHPLALLMIDLDDFKKYNDSYGHEAGNAALNAVADALRGTARSDDLAARYGGEEFVMLVAGNRKAAIIAAERIRSGIQERCQPGGDSPLQAAITVSIGVGILTPAVPTLEALIDIADKALYRAKQSGKNRVVCSAPEESRPERLAVA